MRRVDAAVLMVIYLAFFFGLTLGGFYQPEAVPNFVPFRTIEYDCGRGGLAFVINILGNLAAGFPMGVLLPELLGRGRCSWARVAGAGLAVSLLIETLQGLSGRRCADVDDLILNTLGSLMGLGCWLAAVRLRAAWSRAFDA